MSTLPQRLENRCLNCDSLTHGRFCQVCGQENVVHKMGFFGLIKHFIFDLLHFDGKFFSTIKMLFTKPGQVALEYVTGKRIKHLEPFKMFIFTTTIFFILTSIIPTKSFDGQKGIINFKENDNSVDIDTLRISTFNFGGKKIDFSKYNNFEEIMKDHNKDNSIGFFRKATIKKNFAYYQKYKTAGEMLNGFKNDVYKAAPKIIFCILPFFVGFLQLLHVRHKKWYYNEHGIFSLYHFSFVYILILLTQIAYSIVSYAVASKTAQATGLAIINFTLIFSLAIYTTISLKQFYKQSLGKSFLKMTFLAIGSFFIVTLIFICYLFIYLIFL